MRDWGYYREGGRFIKETTRGGYDNNNNIKRLILTKGCNRTGVKTPITKLANTLASLFIQ